MPRLFKNLAAAATAVAALALTVVLAAPADAASCGSFMSSCASRCKKDNPQDRSCVSDHCSPKMATCKSTGCWTEGGKYGGGTTCSLK